MLSLKPTNIHINYETNFGRWEITNFKKKDHWKEASITKQKQTSIYCNNLV